MADVLRRVPMRVRDEFAARLGPIEWGLLAALVVLPVAFMWTFASPSYFFWDDFGHFYWARNSDAVLPYAFGPSWGHLAPAYRLAYLALDRVAPMNFEVALAVLLMCHAVSAVLLQRILTLLFGRAWWTFVLALAWAISVIYLPAFMWFAAGLHSITAITATLAAIHGYLRWRATGRRAWLVWSLVAMCIGLGFYTKALLIPLYLVLMRVLFLDPAARLRDSLRSVREEWRVWLAYTTVCLAFLLVYALGAYERPEGGTAVGEVLRYLRIFWVEGFSPTVFGVRVPPYVQDDWHRIAIVAAQAVLIGLIVWSVARRRAAWRAWAFLLVTVAANAVMVVSRVSRSGAEIVGYHMYYYTEAALLVPLAVAFAFATTRSRVRVAAVEADVPAAAPGPAEEESFRLPAARVGAVALAALVAYVGVTWATADSLSKPASPSATEQKGARFGRFARAYFDNLRADLAAARRTGIRPSLVDHNVPEPLVPQIINLEPAVVRANLRFSLLSSVVSLFDTQVTFNQLGHLYVVRSDGHLQRTRFVPAAGGTPAALRREGRLRIHEGRAESRHGEWCLVSEGLSALEWEPRPHLRGRDWWLRIRFRTDPVMPLRVHSNPGLGWADEGPKLPPMGVAGTGIADLTELPTGVPTNAGVRVGIPPLGRLCVRSLEIGAFHPPPPSPSADPQPFE